jgi:glycine cleavage system H lipoate-binding protein
MADNASVPGVFNEQSVRTPGGLFFDKTHTWAFMEKEGFVRIWIDDFLQHVTGSITRIDMKNPGDRVKKGDVLFSLIQHGKQLNIKSPISGNIIEKNRLLLTNATLINSNPYSDGWIYTIEPVNWLREIQFLSMAEKYREWLKGEFTRLKDFLASLQKTNELKYAHLVLQDGGELKDGILTEFGPEVWEDFQSNFIEKTK